VAKKLNLQFILMAKKLFTIYVWGGGWLKTSEYRHIGKGGLKLLKKPSYDIWTFHNCINSGECISHIKVIERWSLRWFDSMGLLAIIFLLYFKAKSSFAYKYNI